MEPQLPGVTPLLRFLETGIWVVRDARGDVHVLRIRIDGHDAKCHDNFATKGRYNQFCT